MNKYQKSKIYKIIADDTDKMYIGSTIQELYSRFSKHKEKKDNVCSKELFNYPNTRIQLIEQYACNNKLELRQREQYYINLYKNRCINKCKAYQTEEDYNNQQKEYYIKNHDTIKKRSNDFYKNNKEHVLKRTTNYRNNNLDKIKKKKQELITCECGRIIQRTCKAGHLKTLIHIETLTHINNSV